MKALFRKRGSPSGNDMKIEALDALRANVMIADSDLTITYINPELRTLLEQAEAELKLELPRFDVSRLVGSNIDVFHKSPTHQRTMLAALKTTHRAMITLGKWKFDLVITPVFNGTRRTGFVVEWSDARARLQNVDYAGKMKAVSRTQSIVEFSPEGIVTDANPIFLDLMGYSLEEIKGKHHSLFVAPEEHDTKEYGMLWEKLRQGQYQSARFKRIAKNGKPVWIDGAYNPIQDENGKVSKVVKFATNVTAQANLLSQLYQNFNDIDVAIKLSEAEGASAITAADATLQRVQTVAAGTEQLAGSISEIASRMSDTQSLADQAFKHAVEVDASTSKLASAAREMSGIVDLIGSVAGQINLLSLNATIEAARAGDAGRGFAVVAAEVKNLAKQSADATQRIKGEIEAIQSTSAEVAGAAETIRKAIMDVREYVIATAAAVVEQDTVTGSISSDMKSAAETVSATTKNIGGITTAVKQVSEVISRTKQAAAVLAA